jgi:hypothetical protein
MEFFDSSKSIIENIYFLSAPILLIVAIIGLAQIWVAKYTLKISSKREAALFSFDLCEKYMASTDEIYQTILENLSELKIDYRKIEKTRLDNFTDTEIRSLLSEQYDLISNNYENLKGAFINLLNELERYSLPFISKIADEQIAYDNECINFIHKVKLSSFFIFKSRELRETNLMFENTTKLYAIWHDRLNANTLDEEISDLKDKRSKIKPKKINPIGVK